MKQALHILKKDFRSLRLPLLLLYVVMLVQTAITMRDPLVHDPLESLALVALLVPLSMLVTAGMLVQQESLVGTTAFWMTKPVSRGSLLLSKTLFLLVFVLLPAVAATLAVGLAYGIEPLRLAPAIGVSSMSMISMLMGAVLLAALTPNVPAYLVVGIGFVLANQLLGTLIEHILPREYAGANASVGGAVFLISGILLILHQYFRRRTRHTVIAFAVAWMAGMLAAHFWPWRFTVEPNYRFTDNDIQVALHPGQTEVFFADPHLDVRVTIAATPEVRKAPAGYDLKVFLRSGELYVDQETYTLVSGQGAVADSGGIEAAMPGFRRIGRRPAELLRFSVHGKRRIDPDELFDKPATLRATLIGTLYEYRIAGTLPLVSGARLGDGEVGAVVQGVLPRVHSVDVGLRVRYVELREGERPFTEFARILLVNRRRREMLEIDTEERASISRLNSLIGPPMIYASNLKLSFNSAPPQNQQVDPEWMREAEIIFLEKVPAGRFRTQLDVSGFRLSDEPFAQRGTSP